MQEAAREVHNNNILLFLLSVETMQKTTNQNKRHNHATLADLVVESPWYPVFISPSGDDERAIMSIVKPPTQHLPGHIQAMVMAESA